MFDVLKTLSVLVSQKQNRKKSKPTIKPSETPLLAAKPVAPPPKAEVAVVSEELQAAVKLAEAQAKELILEAKEQAHKIRREVDDEIHRKKIDIERKEQQLADAEKKIKSTEEDINRLREEVDKKKQETIQRLEKVSSLTRDEAKDFILNAVREKLKEEIAKEIKEAQSKAEEEAEEKAKEILVTAMRHGATDYVAEYTVSVVKIPDEDVKGRIIGKEGRNIRTFEAATGVDVDLDEEGIIRLSCFDPVRREVARISLERLMRDGRVQPGRIEEIVEQVKKELDRVMFEEGQKLCHAVGVYNLPSPIVAVLGRFKFRFSYGQNMIAHTLEETKIGVAIAQEIGCDVNIVRLGCLLHDIGKVVTDKEGSHVELGVELLKKYGLPNKVVDCVAQHHEDTPFTSLESMLVYIADAISGGRPGARYENYDEYVKRLTDIETIAKSHKGVKESFAFQAGREVRIVVDPGSVDDAGAVVIAHDVKEEIEKKVTYPGQIKISVIREVRVTEVAK